MDLYLLTYVLTFRLSSLLFTGDEKSEIMLQFPTPVDPDWRWFPN